MNQTHFAWDEKYRPNTVDECILPKRLKETFKGFIAKKDVPNCLLVGPPGCGKTTVALAVLNELGYDKMKVNGSLHGDIGTLRNDITTFASSMSFSEGRKYVILDEADHLTYRVQPALRTFIEEYSMNCGFILTANYANGIIEPLQSRCPPILFNLTKKEELPMCVQFFGRVEMILKAEGVAYDKAVLVDLIWKYRPDWRRILGVLQAYASKNDKIDAGILESVDGISIGDLVVHLKKQDIPEIRQWVAENSTVEPATIFRGFYDAVFDYFDESFIPELIEGLALYQYKASMVRDQEINMAAFLVWVAFSAKWK